MKDYLLIIDGSSLLTTQFFGNLPREIIFAKTMEEKALYFPKIMQTSGGVYTNAVYGFVRVLLKILKEQKPAYLAVAWDVSRNTFRREIYPDYKGNRGETMPPLKEQFVLCQEVLKSMKVPQFMDEHYEADDFSGTLTAMFEHQVPVRIMTKDHDYLQLVSDNTKLWMIHSTAKKTEELYEKYGMRQKDYDVPDRTFPFDPELVEKEFGVLPESINSLKGLQGDASDNIKGVPGVGEMTAAALIHEYGSVEKLYEVLHALDEAGRKKLAEDWKQRLGIKRSPIGALLKESETELVGEKAALLSKQLATIKKDIPLKITLEDLRVNIDAEAAREQFARLEFKSLKLESGEEENDFVPSEANPFSAVPEEGSATDADGFAAAGEGNPFAGAVSEGTAGAGNAAGDAASSGSAPESARKGMQKDVPMSRQKDAPDIPRGGAHNALEPGAAPSYREPEQSLELSELTEEVLEAAARENAVLAFELLVSGGEVYQAAFMTDAARVYVGRTDGKTVMRLLGKAAGLGMLLVTNGLKEQLGALDTEALYRLSAKRQLFDIRIVAYLLNPLRGAYDYAVLANELYGIALPEVKDLYQKLSLPEAALFAADGVKKRALLSCNMSFLLAGWLKQALEAKGLDNLFYELEMPLVFTLYAMQQRGIRVQKDELAKYAEQLGDRVGALEKEIWELAGEQFNINSPKQLGVILFEKLGLKGGKKTKTGYSTSAEVLERLSGEHAIVDRILEYRQLAKLKSTYADGLTAYIGEDGRIHGSFHQTATATGRISSTEPNLQNIPIRMEAGSKLRRVFVPEEGFVFLDADYSQIELRVLAHMSGDERLIAAYNEAQDIHRITAAQVFNTPFDEVTKEQRSRAKAVNFGIVYGISSFGLGQGLNISRHEAEEYMKNYFDTYPGVKDFMDRLVADAREKKESETMFGRIRPLPDIASTNFMKRQAEERVAMNAPIQGTAADIMKIAMLRVDRRLIEGGYRSRLLLQIHDELLVETAVEEKEAVKQILIEEMSGAAQLRVPLEVSAGEGDNWLDAH